MNKFVAVLSLLFISSFAHACVAATTGKWRVTHYLAATELSASPTILRRYEGKTIIITKSLVKFAHETCKIDKQREIKTSRDARKYFLREFKADYAKLKLVAPIHVIESDCNTVITDSHHRMIFDWNGDFFETMVIKQNKYH